MSTEPPFDAFRLALSLWPLYAVVLAAALIREARALVEWARLSHAGLRDIDRMDGRTFEKYLGTLFTRLGYRVEATPYQGDWGADLVLSRDGARTAVQARRHKKRVGMRAVQEVAAAKGRYHCEHAIVVTNSDYTDQARALARCNRVQLWDRRRLVREALAVRRPADGSFGEDAPHPPAAPAPAGAAR